MENNNENTRKSGEQNPAPHGPTDHNPYPYPIQQPNKRGWLKALFALIIVAVLVTLFCVVVGVFEHHESTLDKNAPVETVLVEP